jgi:hypothetical protein
MSGSRSSLLLVAEKIVDVSMAFKDVDDLEAPGVIAEEDHIPFERKATNVGAQFRARSAHHGVERGELVTLRAQFCDESLCEVDAAAPSAI